MSGAAPIDLGLLPRSARVDDAGRLLVGGCDVEELADVFGTPLYVYDEGELRARCREYADAFGGDNVSYASKAFLCTAMARLVAQEGLQLEVASGGEAFVARRAGFPAARMAMHGNNKSDAELRTALTEGFGRVVVDSFDELARIERLVADGCPPPTVLLRVTPGVEAHTHEYIATGADDSKFGLTVSSGAAREAALHAVKSGAMHLAGFHCHIGSQIFALESFVLAAEVVSRLAAEVRDATGHLVEELNLGGGLAVPYTADDLDAPSIAEFGAALRDGFAHACAAAGLEPAPRLCVEAGRSIAAPAGFTLYTVGTIKEIRLGGPGGDGALHTYVAVDGGLGDNPRVALYGAQYEAFLPARAGDERPFVATVAGRHCEQGDLLVTDAQLPADVQLGDVLATPVTGAYGQSMGSTYNLMPRPAVVFVHEGRARVVVRRETYDDLVARDEPLRDENRDRHEGD